MDEKKDLVDGTKEVIKNFRPCPKILPRMSILTHYGFLTDLAQKIVDSLVLDKKQIYKLLVEKNSSGMPLCAYEPTTIARVLSLPENKFKILKVNIKGE